jgi:hypothetical protein
VRASAPRHGAAYHLWDATAGFLCKHKRYDLREGRGGRTCG